VSARQGSKGGGSPAGVWGRLLAGAGSVAAVAGVAAVAARRHATRVAAERALGRLADQQAALRRVATLVARGVPAAKVFAAVAEEAGRLLNAEIANVARYEPDGTVTVVAGWSERGGHMPVGGRFSLEGQNLAVPVLRTGRPARIESYHAADGPISSFLAERGISAGVGSPIVVDGRLWGLVSVLSTGSPPADTEQRLAEFTELVATAISNAQARAELDASRRRIVAAGDKARRRIERDLHDGIQQRLVSLALELRAAEGAVPAGSQELREQIGQIREGLGGALDELREVSHGIHPAILSQGGLGSALRALARRSAVPVELDLRLEAPLPEPVEVAAYYVVAEALANAAKHAQASVARLDAEASDSAMRLEIRDDGVGGADLSRGTGLIGLRDRVEALGGTLTMESPAGNGTSVLVRLPLDTP
jgi:signal transduction histidine kinase